MKSLKIAAPVVSNAIKGDGQDTRSGAPSAHIIRMPHALLLCVVTSACAVQPPSSVRHAADPVVGSYANQVISANASLRRYPRLTSIYPAATLEQAYASQRAIVAHRTSAGSNISGYKGGLVTAAAQTAMNARAPTIGVLFGEGAMTAPASVRLSDFRTLVVECELGFRFAKRVAHPVHDVGILKDLVSEMGPVIELPDSGFEDPTQLDARDLVSTNMSSARYVLGPVMPIAEAHNITEIEPVLMAGARSVATGKGTVTMDDQWRGLLELVNLTIEQGYRIERGQTIIAGSLHATVASQGHYTCSLGQLGEVAINVVP